MFVNVCLDHVQIDINDSGGKGDLFDNLKIDQSEGSVLSSSSQFNQLQLDNIAEIKSKFCCIMITDLC